ncbi:phosphatidylinositol N-acetylglucosaminyltransferase subunit H-like [Spodoptera frugiperda]|uniref:Phosphatidylinositol N-acetylglucosaminyltransferase subunit H-like n=1 Tax=Spodoptera frugiperda TaxID=7108 RepID=A0A9R0DQH4_SPOFR|nr:phosphatidylinositol N-acetylglucosaminyltransferase subunit H-like [Spodoptera frugiperda]
MANQKPTTSLEYENVNGIKLVLNVHKRQTPPDARIFTITYKNVKSNSSKIGAKASLFLAIIFNLIALFYVRISLTAILVIIIVLSFLVFFWFTHSVQSESLIVIPTVCIQSTVKYVWGREDTFVDWSNVDDVIINEVIKMNRVLYYLTLLKKEDNPDSVRLVPLFKYTKPRLVMLQKIYSEIQTFLMDAQKESAMASGDKE